MRDQRRPEKSKCPIALIEEYIQPPPKPSGAMVGKIKELVTELNADDWAARQKAQEKLVSMGTSPPAS